NTIGKTVTDKDGHFTLTGIPLGDYTIEASSPGLVEDHQHLQITSSQVLTVELVLVDTEEVIRIEEDWALPPPPKATGSVVAVGRQTLAELPGADDRPITDVMAKAPGFVEDSLGEVYVRGQHGNIQYQVDGIPVPDSVGSMFAASIPVRLVQQLEIMTGGIPAEYGYRLGAIVNLVTRNAAEHPEGNLSLRYGSFDTVEPGLVYSAKLSDRTGMVIGGSATYSQRALDAPSIDPILHDTGLSARVFTRFDYQPCESNRYELFAMYAHNRFEVPIDPAARPFEPTRPRPVDKFGNEAPAFIPHDTDAREHEHEAFAAFSWIHKLQRGQLMLAPLYKLSRGTLVGDAEHALGDGADPGSTASDVKRTAHHAGGIAAYSWQNGRHLVKSGLQTDFLYGSSHFTLYERDDVNGGIASSTSGHDRTEALLSGAYVQDHVTLGDAALDAGIRIDQLHVMLQGGGTDDSFGVSPRLGLSYSFAKDVVGHVFSGVMWLPPSPLDAASAARALGVVPADQPVTYDLKPETDLYSEVGILARLSKLLRGGLTAWGRYSYNQLDDTAIGSTSLDSNYNFKRGRAAGLEGSLELRVGPWLSGFANASLGFAQGRGIASATFLFSPDDLADNTWQSLDHAQTWTGNAGATVRDGRFTVTGMFTYGSGLRTGPANDQHVPGHLVADLSSQYTFVAREYPIRLGIDIENLFDRRYAFRIGNGFVGSSYGAPRSVFVSLSIPLATEPHINEK
ncbi:MAG TPA: TonB-dependent receptor, partial [Kofleriaceae bacterium]|nr:TonB-dependent receptor [Kofleriaceae bacterium]